MITSGTNIKGLITEFGLAQGFDSGWGKAAGRQAALHGAKTGLNEHNHRGSLMEKYINSLFPFSASAAARQMARG